MNLWRPVGLEELALLFDSGMRAFPPRLPEQPIFYPVLNPEYAAQIAREWNTQEGAAAGYVTDSLPNSLISTGTKTGEASVVPAIRGSCWKAYGAHVPGTVILTRPPWALAVSIWPCMPGIGTFVAVGSHWPEVLNHATGFSCGSIREVVGRMCPELMIERSFIPVV